MSISACSNNGDDIEPEDTRKDIETYLDNNRQSSGTLLFYVGVSSNESSGGNFEFELELGIDNQTKKDKEINITNVSLIREKDNLNYQVTPDYSHRKNLQVMSFLVHAFIFLL